MTTPADRNRLAALLAHHADVLAAALRADVKTGLPEYRAGVDRAVGLLDLHAAHLTADEETAAVRELLDSILSFEAERPDLAHARQLLGTGEQPDAEIESLPCAQTGHCNHPHRVGQPTPADPETDEEREQREDQEETARLHAAGDHRYCGVTCEVEMPSDMLRNFIVAKGYPGTAGALDELLRRESTARRIPGTTVQADTETAPARVGRCAVMFEGGGRCEKDADHRAGRWSDDPHTPTPAAEEATR